MHIINSNIYVSQEFLSAEFLRKYIKSTQVLIVTDSMVASLHLDPLLVVLQEYSVAVLELPLGEEHKSWSSVEKILQKLIACEYDRSATIISLGGGLIGDLTGLAAALFMRGISWLQLPTTLLAQVDAAIGGKTGCNFQGQKNLIGVFYQPQAVWIDINYLTSLPQRQFIAGMAEVIKYGVVCDAGFFCWLESNHAAILQREPQTLQYMVARCCALKQAIVDQDVYDNRQRMILNFGHSFGHALEVATDFKFYLHGEAVAIGMLLASRLAVKIGLLEQKILARLVDLLTSFGLDLQLRPEQFTLDMLHDYIRYDKKKRAGVLNFVLPCALGEAVIVPEHEINCVKEILHNHV